MFLKTIHAFLSDSYEIGRSSLFINVDLDGLENSMEAMMK